jgi:hypothetical protein
MTSINQQVLRPLKTVNASAVKKHARRNELSFFAKLKI